MARIAGVDLPDKKKILYALPHIYGIGPSNARKIVAAAQVDPNKRVSELTDDEITRIRKEIESNYKVEGVLRAEIAANIKRYIEIGCYRGMRHRAGLPVRGQRTRTNARTRKGPRKTSGVLKVKAEKPSAAVKPSAGATGGKSGEKAS
uniref:Small ribosomal subunit protein uS13 n=1 Tax=candidate division WOR-3 bacterium TaxID=2052148 RepID=A0A7C6A8X3_UNCW3